MNKINLMFYALALASLLTVVSADAQSSLSVTICGLVSTVRNIVGALALVLFIIGGVMYAISHFIPTSVKFREELQGWSTAMIIGGVIGLVIVIVAPQIVTLFENLASGAGGVTGSTPISC